MTGTVRVERGFGEGFVQVGGMHVDADGVFGQADLGRAVFSVEDAADRLVGLDLLALGPEPYAQQGSERLWLNRALRQNRA
jgi:hypothetical protein